jgi:hypothetical protein
LHSAAVSGNVVRKYLLRRAIRLNCHLLRCLHNQCDFSLLVYLFHLFLNFEVDLFAAKARGCSLSLPYIKPHSLVVRAADVIEIKVKVYLHEC